MVWIQHWTTNSQDERNRPVLSPLTMVHPGCGSVLCGHC